MAKKRKQQADPSANRSELRRLLEAAKADHHDDGPRLALADWLEEHGGEADRARAEIIRLQLDTDNGGPPWQFAVDRLRDKYVREWVGPAKGLFAKRLPTCERGLLVSDVSSRTWITEEIRGLKPCEEWDWVETARFQALPAGHVERLLASSLLATVPCLDLDAHLPSLALRTLAAHRQLGRRRSLRVILAGGAEDAVVNHFLPSPHLAGLAELELWGHRPGLRVWQRLAAAEGLAGLRRLHLGRSDLDDDGAVALGGSPNLRGLQELVALSPTFGARGAAALFGAPTFEGLRRLTFGRAVPVLKGAPFFSSLERLGLVDASPQGDVAALTALPKLPRLRHLSLAYHTVPLEGIEALVRAPLLGGLESLNLSLIPLGERGAAALVSSGHAAPRALRLQGCGLGNEGVARLASWPGLARVRYLDLKNNGIRPEGVRALAESPHTGAMEALDLSDNLEMGALAIEVFLRSPLASRLRWLSLGGSSLAVLAKLLTDHPLARARELFTGLSSGNNGPVLARLRAAMPDCAIG